MKIEVAESKDLIDIIYLFKECSKDMNLRGDFSWNQYYPGNDILKKQIDKKSLFVVKHLGICIGCMVLDEEPLSEYNKVKWIQKDSKNLIIHWLAIHPFWQGKGIAQVMMEYAEKYAKEKGYASIRLNIYGTNEIGLTACNDKGFSETGEIYMPFQQTPFKCFEKVVK